MNRLDFFGGFPIRNRTAFYSMLVFGFFLIFFGLFTEDVVVFFGGSVVTPYLLFVFGLVVVLLTWSELGLKRYTDFSRLRRFGSQQLVTFVVSVLVLLSTGLGAFVPGLNDAVLALGWFNSGIFVVSGLVVIMEAVR